MQRRLSYEELEHRILELQKAEYELNQVKAALRISEERYCTAQAISHSGNWEYNTQTTQFWGSPEARRIYGLDPEQLDFSTEEIENCIPERERVHQALVDLIQDGKPYHLEFEILPKNSNVPKIISSVAELKQNERGELIVVGVIQDITDRKRIEEALRESENRLQLVMEGSRLGYWDWNIETGEVKRNNLWAEMLGYTLEEIQLNVRQWTDLHHPDDRAAAWKSIQDHLDGKTPAHQIEYRMRTKDGRYKWILDQARVVKRDVLGKPLRMCGTHSDITERRQSEETNKMVSDLTAMINTPGDFRNLMRELTRRLHDWSECEAVGIRLKEGDDYPYYESLGFPPVFVKLERSLCDYAPDGSLQRDENGKPVLECMCGNILQGRFDPAKSFFTVNGSFCSNNTTLLLASTTDADRQARTRNRCNGFGYESVALIPLRYGSEVFGLIQLNDHRPNRFNHYLIAGLEKAAENIAIALSRRQIEEVLLTSKAQLETALASMTDAVFISDNGGRFIHFNDAFATFHKFKNKEECAKTLSEYPEFLDVFLANGEPAPLVQWAVPRALRGEYGTNVEYSLRRKDTGESWTGSYSFAPIRNQGGEIVGSVVSARDITEKKMDEEALRKSEDRFKRLFYYHSAAKLVIDPESGAIVDANKAAEKFYGWTTEELKGMRIQQVSMLSPEELATNISIAMTANSPKFELKHRRKDGASVDVEVFTNKIDIEGKPLLFSIIHDITERKRIEREQVILQDQLRQSQKMESVGRLAGGVAHDFNNMLAIILGNAEIAMDNLDPSSPLHTDLEEIQKAANRSADLVRQLLAFARKQTISPKVLNLNGTVEGMLKMLKRLVGENIDMAWLPGEKVWPVRMDPSQIDQILANLCVNARDAIKDVGKITIETGKTTIDEAFCRNHAGFIPGEYVLLAVSDNGCGMSKETMKNLFEPFFTTKELGKGTGLGLATIYGIVKQNSGFIDVYSEPEKGTTFKIYLPRYEDKSKQINKTGQATEAAGGKETILLVEDEQAILKMTTVMLERLGYHVLGAHTPAEAIRKAREYSGEIHLLMTDVVMPEMNGRDMATNLLSLYPNLKCLFMSGYTANVIAHHGVLDEGVNFIEKPFSRQDLAAMVRKTLSGTEKKIKSSEYA